MDETTSAAGVRTDDHDDGYFEWTRPELRRLVPAAARRVLDVGCGAGALGGALRAERGIEVVGVELFGDAAARAAERLDAVHVADLDVLTELPYGDGHFDAMVFGDVLEHLRDPHRLLRALRRYLADDGALVCSIPNVKHWSVVYPLLVQDRWRYEDAGLLDRTHVHFFTLEEIDRMLAACGYEAVGVGTVAHAAPPELALLAALVGRLGGDEREARARLDAYQYLVVARPALDAPLPTAEQVAPAPAVGAGAAGEAADRDDVATAAAAPAVARPGVTLLVALDGTADDGLRCLTSVAALGAGEPDHDVVVVAEDSPALAPLLAQLDGDVTIVRSPAPEPFLAALRRGLPHCRGDVVVLAPSAPVIGPGALSALVSALGGEGVVAATSPRAGADPDAAVEAGAIAVGRAQLERIVAAGLPRVAPQLEVAALCVALAARGRLVPAPAAEATPARARRGLVRRAPGAAVELSIVIPTLDAASDRTRACVAAAQATTDVACELIVLDNGAPPQGFTAPVNAGLRAARGEYLVVLNDDVELLPGWWPPLRAALDDGASVAFPETIEGPMRRDFAAWCFAFTRATLEAFEVRDGEFLDPELVVWYQDTDLLQRLRAAGRPPQHVPAARIRHGLSQTVNADDPALKAWIARQVGQDRTAFEAKHGPAVAGAAR